MLNPTSIIRFLLRGPSALESRAARWTVLALAATGAAFLVWSAVIHLELWGDGYSTSASSGRSSSPRASARSSSRSPSSPSVGWRCWRRAR